MASAESPEVDYRWYVSIPLLQQFLSCKLVEKKIPLLTLDSCFRTPLSRNYEAERSLPNLEDGSSTHPLVEAPKAAPVVVTQATLPSATSKPALDDPLSSEVIDDPLGASSSFDDPLSAALNAALSKPGDGGLSSSSSSNLLRSSSSYNYSSSAQSFQSYQDDAEDQKLLFAPRKAGILTKYTTTESITIPGFVAGVGRSTSFPLSFHPSQTSY